MGVNEEPIRKEFTESYVSVTLPRLYAWWQVDKPDRIRIAEYSSSPAVLVISRAELIELAKELEK